MAYGYPKPLKSGKNMTINLLLVKMYLFIIKFCQEGGGLAGVQEFLQRYLLSQSEIHSSHFSISQILFCIQMQGSIFYMKIIFFPTLTFQNAYFFHIFQDMKGTKSFTKLWKNHKTSLIFMKTISQIN